MLIVRNLNLSRTPIQRAEAGTQAARDWILAESIQPVIDLGLADPLTVGDDGNATDPSNNAVIAEVSLTKLGWWKVSAQASWTTTAAAGAGTGLNFFLTGQSGLDSGVLHRALYSVAGGESGWYQWPVSLVRFVGDTTTAKIGVVQKTNSIVTTTVYAGVFARFYCPNP